MREKSIIYRNIYLTCNIPKYFQVIEKKHNLNFSIYQNSCYYKMIIEFWDVRALSNVSVTLIFLLFFGSAPREVGEGVAIYTHFREQGKY